LKSLLPGRKVAPVGLKSYVCNLEEVRMEEEGDVKAMGEKITQKIRKLI